MHKNIPTFSSRTLNRACLFANKDFFEKIFAEGNKKKPLLFFCSLISNSNLNKHKITLLIRLDTLEKIAIFQNNVNITFTLKKPIDGI